MTATRVIDDHIELANIGTKTHAEIESHIQGIGNYTLPAADGNADQLLKTSGAGVLSWIDKPAGFACGSLNACNITDIGTRAHASLTGIGTSDHHVKYTDAEAVTAMGAKADANPLHHDKMVVDAVHVQNYQEGTIGVASGVVVPLDFDNDVPPFQHAVVEYDYGGMYDNSNSERITCKKAGLYLVIAKIYWSFNANGSYRGIYFYKNGVYLTGDSPGPHQSGGFFQTVMIPVSLAVNDYLSLKVYQDSGAIVTLYYGYYYTGLWATLLREF